MKKPIILILILSFLPIRTCKIAKASEYSFVQSKTINIESIKKGLIPLDFSNNYKYSKINLEYFSYYGLNFDKVKHVFGTFKSGSKVLAAHFYIPNKYTATVVLMHGYLDHTGILKNAIKDLLEQNYAVAVYDVQGHGLSSEERAEINDFRQYSVVFDDFMNITKNNLHGPYNIISFSMGAAITMEYLLNQGKYNFDKIVFVAPLVKSASWQVSKIGYFFGKYFLDNVPRSFRNDSSDKEFLSFYRNDPLQTKKIPLVWVNALIKWNERIKSTRPNNKKILILQGTKDRIVSWRENLEFLKTKFPNAKVVLIQDADHQLYNENRDIRMRVFNEINSYLQ
ncbi:MAG: hypothetical protein A3J83_05150 [Elusimicrobia bacterium RIFOXYA2_FULL_40_6]|nr:MAG: hypothetical protein A3J83_05150 [Elusimicrobia bacterium RIFOXYA2_FULL_40_6]